MEWPDLTFPPLNLWNFPRQSFLYDKGNTMNISLTDTNGTYSITLNEDFVTLEEIIALLVKPVLLAASFSEEQLDDYFVNENKVQIVFNDWTDEDEEEFTKAMEKVVCKKEVVVAPKVATVAPKQAVEKKVAKAAG